MNKKLLLFTVIFMSLFFCSNIALADDDDYDNYYRHRRCHRRPHVQTKVVYHRPYYRHPRHYRNCYNCYDPFNYVRPFYYFGGGGYYNRYYRPYNRGGLGMSIRVSI